MAEASDAAVIAEATRKAHERLFDNSPWRYVVHDLNPRAMSPKVKGSCLRNPGSSTSPW
jgi:peptide/nickel transport system substrate-binding protein